MDVTAHIQSFPPISDAKATVLILGSIPGKASLMAEQYYAHPRNSFWRIMERVAGIDFALSYEDRCAQLIRSRIAVWDVLKACTRSSSLDSDIVESSIVPNEFGRFFETHAQIRALYFNGAKAEQAYRKYVLPDLPEASAGISALRLPSTSPANASMSFDVKLKKWEAILPFLWKR